MMVFNLYVQQNQWLVVTVCAGIILTILTILTYWGMWRSRQQEAEQEKKIEITGPASFFQWVLTFMPWVLILIIVGSVLYTFTHLHMAATGLPNW